MGARAPESGEDRLIARYLRPIAKHPGALSLTDDAALLTPPQGHDLVLTVDAIVAGVHFFAADPPDTIARKALRVNLSDLAAKGAQPVGALLSLSIPAVIGESWIAEFARGLGEDGDTFGCPLLGGDTTHTDGSATISITAIGSVPSGQMVRRSGAKPGDLLAVTGTIGDGALGLLLRRDAKHAAFADLAVADRAALASRYLLPLPRIALATVLRDVASAAIDISDGLAGDVAKVASASGVGARIDCNAIPLSSAVRAALNARPELLETVLSGGDDYEIAFTLAPDRVDGLRAAAKAANVPVTTIGRIEAGNVVDLMGADGQPMRLKKASFSHF